MRRRSFLKGGLAALGSVSAPLWGRRMAGADSMQERTEAELGVQQDAYEAPAWLRYSRTVNFEGYLPPVYKHMKEFDAKRLVESVREVGADTLRFAATAYWAYYPSKAFPVHDELDGRDLIDEVSRECQRLGVRLYAYTVYGAYFTEAGWVEQHPEFADWVLRGPDGKPYAIYPHCGWPPQYRVCIMGDAYRQGMRAVVRELCDHQVEGVYFDAPCGYRGICFCEDCRRNFKTFSGMDIERLSDCVRKYASAALPNEWSSIPGDVDIEALTAWYEWANQLVKEDLLDFRKTIHDSKKFMLCHNGTTWRGGTALFEQYRIPDGFMVEHIPQTYQRLITGMMGASMARPYGKLVQMYLGSYTDTMSGQPAHESPWALHDASLEDADEILMEGFADLACGNAPLYCTGNRLYYHRGSGSSGPVKEVFGLMERAEPILKDSTPLPYLTIVPTWESLQLWRSRGRSWNGMMSEGLALAMLDEHIGFDVNPSTEMSEEWLQQQQVIALCGASGISDEQAQRLADWVRRGGGLLATYDTGLYDGKGQLRQDGGALREVLGVEMKGKPLESLPECYYRVQRAHSALGQYSQGTMVQGDGQLVPVNVREGAIVLADCWCVGTEKSLGPAVVARSYGKGRTIYVAGSLEAHYPASRVASFRRILGSMVSYLGGEAPKPFTLSAPTGVYGVLRRARNGDLVMWVLANVGFKDASAGRMRQDFVPVSNVEIGVRVPQGRQVRSIRLLRASRNVPFRLENGYAMVKIASLHIAEAVHLELG